ncbi:MAG: hypothetical protein HKN42_14165 [Granulosicoccus sp.]|nr:hypothetical protein [Granulosicoccus sp.]
MKYRAALSVCLLASLLSVALWAQDRHSGHSPGMSPPEPITPVVGPQEGGQSAFAAIAETVALLEADPNTNWATVNIEALRLHLLDMHHLVLETSSVTDIHGDRAVRYSVRGADAAIPAIHRMVPAHSRFLEQSRNWQIETDITDSGATIVVNVDSADTVIRLLALGFYGFMSLDSHHPAHHLQIATGRSH